MYKGFLYLSLLVVSYRVCNGQVGAVVNIAKSLINLIALHDEEKLEDVVNTQVGDVVNVAKSLIKLFAHDEEKLKDLTAADELVRGITFDQFDEKVSCRVSKGIYLKDFAMMIQNFAVRFNIPNDIKSSLLDGLVTNVNYEVIKIFSFSKGKGGDFTFGRIATVRHGDMIDMAYSVYILKYKISPVVIEHTREKKFLFFTIGNQVWHESKERDMSSKEKNDFDMYAMKKAIQGFKDQYAGLIEEQYCTNGKDCE